MKVPVDMQNPRQLCLSLCSLSSFPLLSLLLLRWLSLDTFFPVFVSSLWRQGFVRPYFPLSLLVVLFFLLLPLWHSRRQ